MSRKSPLAVVCTIALLWCLWTGTAIADESATVSPPSTSTALSLDRLLERLQGDPKLQRLVEEDLQKSIAIRVQIQEEVDRAFNHTTSLLNTLLAILTSLPVLAAVGIWFIRRSVVNQVVAETKRQVREEVEQQLQAEVKAELKQQTEAFQQEIEELKAEFAHQLSQLKSLFSDAQKHKDQIIQELAKLTPSPMRDSATPETQQKIQALTQQLERLQSSNTQLAFTANDYVEQGKAFYFEGRYEDAIACHEKALHLEPDNPRAWLSQGAAYAKLQQWEAAIAAYETTIQFKPDLSEAWFGKGIALAKLQQWEAAIAAYETAIQLKPDFLPAWFGRARCHALQGNVAAAVADLQQAIVLNPDKSREALKTDPSFDSLRDQPQFQQLLSTS